MQQEVESSQAASYNGADDSHAESYAAASGVEDEEVEEEDVPPPVEEGYDNESFAEDIDSIRSVIENCLKFVCYMNLPLLKSPKHARQIYFGGFLNFKRFYNLSLNFS